MNTVSSLALCYPLIGNQKVFPRFSDSLSIVNAESFSDGGNKKNIYVVNSYTRKIEIPTYVQYVNSILNAWFSCDGSSTIQFFFDLLKR
jgi:hypothetical protein